MIGDTHLANSCGIGDIGRNGSGVIAINRTTDLVGMMSAYISQGQEKVSKEAPTTSVNIGGNTNARTRTNRNTKKN